MATGRSISTTREKSEDICGVYILEDQDLTLELPHRCKSSLSTMKDLKKPAKTHP